MTTYVRMDMEFDPPKALTEKEILESLRAQCWLKKYALDRWRLDSIMKFPDLVMKERFEKFATGYEELRKQLKLAEWKAGNSGVLLCCHPYGTQ